jgi:hypothetical protein
MAAVYLYNSAASTNPRVSLQADDATGIFTIAVEDAADNTEWSAVLSSAERTNILAAWRAQNEAIVSLGAASDNKWVGFSKDGEFVCRGTLDAGDADTATDEIVLTVSGTAAMMGWLDQYSV